jgi:hypothetical protein
MMRKKRVRAVIIASAAVICAAALASCVSGPESGDKLPEIPAEVEALATGDDSTGVRTDLTQGLEFEILSVSGCGTVHARLTNIASPYTVTAVKEYCVSDENGNVIPFIPGVGFDDPLLFLGIGESEDYAFEVGELDADMKPGNYFINTNVFISSGGGEPVVQMISVLFTSSTTASATMLLHSNCLAS